MKFRLLCSLFLLASCDELAQPITAARCGPGPGGDDAVTAPIPSGVLLSLGVAADFSSSAVDKLTLDALDSMEPNRLVATGDAALRKLGDQAVVLNRGAASNLQLVDASISRSLELSFDVCNPHDIVMTSGCAALASCYDSVRLKRVDFATGAVSDGPDLSAFADADGLPEQDQLVRVGDKIYVSLQRLDRDAFYTPVGNAKLAVIDAETLTIDDEEGIELPCQNPYTDLELMPDGRIAVACAGDFVTMSTQRVVAYDPESGATEVLIDGDVFGGSPSALRVGSDGALYLLITVPDAFSAEAMQLVRVTGDTVDVLYEREGYNLSGLAVSEAGDVYVGDRSAAHAGIYHVAPGANVPTGPIATGLPPYELEVF